MFKESRRRLIECARETEDDCIPTALSVHSG
jgi:hypothetical protein